MFDFKVYQNIIVHCIQTSISSVTKPPLVLAVTILAPLRCGYATLYSRKLPNLFPLEKDIKSKL